MKKKGIFKGVLLLLLILLVSTPSFGKPKEMKEILQILLETSVSGVLLVNGSTDGFNGTINGKLISKSNFVNPDDTIEINISKPIIGSEYVIAVRDSKGNIYQADTVTVDSGKFVKTKKYITYLVSVSAPEVINEVEFRFMSNVSGVLGSEGANLRVRLTNEQVNALRRAGRSYFYIEAGTTYNNFYFEDITDGSVISLYVQDDNKNKIGQSNQIKIQKKITSYQFNISGTQEAVAEQAAQAAQALQAALEAKKPKLDQSLQVRQPAANTTGAELWQGFTAQMNKQQVINRAKSTLGVSEFFEYTEQFYIYSDDRDGERRGSSDYRKQDSANFFINDFPRTELVLESTLSAPFKKVKFYFSNGRLFAVIVIYQQPAVEFIKVARGGPLSTSWASLYDLSVTVSELIDVNGDMEGNIYDSKAQWTKWESKTRTTVTYEPIVNWNNTKRAVIYKSTFVMKNDKLEEIRDPVSIRDGINRVPGILYIFDTQALENMRKERQRQENEARKEKEKALF